MVPSSGQALGERKHELQGSNARTVKCEFRAQEIKCWLKMSVMPDVVVSISKEPKDFDSEKPDDYDKVARPLRALKRLVLFAPRLLKKFIVWLWKRLWGTKPKT